MPNGAPRGLADGFRRTDCGFAGHEGVIDAVGTAPTRATPWLAEEPIGRVEASAGAAQPVSAKGTAANSERMDSGRPARRCPNASAIITASATPTRVRIRASPRMKCCSNSYP